MFKKILKVALPLAGQNILSSLTNLVDVLFVGLVSTKALSAFGIVSSLVGLQTMFIFSILSVINIYATQYFGKGEDKPYKDIFKFSMFVSLISSILSASLFLLLQSLFIKLFTSDVSITSLAKSYMLPIILSTILANLTFVITSYVRIEDKGNVPLYIEIVTLISNYCFDWLLYRKFGMAGIGYATLFVRVIEIFIFIIYLNFSKVKFYTSLLTFKWSRKFYDMMYKKMLESMFGQSVWYISIILMSIFYARLGTKEFASIQASSTLTSIVYAMFAAFSASSGIVVGKTLGASDDKEEIKKDTDSIIKASLIIGFCLTVILASLSLLVKLLFPALDATTIMYTKQVIWTVSLIMPPYLTMFVILGMLKSGGLIRETLYINTYFQYIFQIPVLVALVYFKVNLIIGFGWVYFSVNIFEYLKFIFAYTIYKKYKWINKLV